MKRAATLDAELKQVKAQLAEAKLKIDEMYEIRDEQGRQLETREADIEELTYQNGKLLNRVDALEYSLVLAQAHAQPMQRKLFHQARKNQATAPDMRARYTGNHEAQLKHLLARDKVSLAS